MAGRRRGTTLIEVLAGLVILATLLVAVSVARGRFLRQWADADARLRAARAADVLMASWTSGDTIAVPANASGPLDGVRGGRWRTRVIPSASAADVSTRIVRLEVSRQLTAAEGARDEPVLSVDLLTPAPRRVQPARATR
jgi:prepilin-type N-terminal cleavage/methylation domain-containing protein